MNGENSLQFLKEFDRDRNLAALLVREEVRAALSALWAFETEMSRIPYIVSEPTLGEIRLQWWRDAIGSEGAGQGHPLAEELLAAINQYNLDRSAFDKSLAARISDFYQDPITDINAFEGYAGEAFSLLIREAAVACGAPSSSALADAAGYGGVCWCVTQKLRSFARDALSAKMMIPLDVLGRHQCSLDEISSGNLSDPVKASWSEMITYGRKMHDEALAAIKALPKEVKPAFLPLCLVPAYLDRMDQKGFNPFTNRAELSQLRVQWLLWRNC